MYCNVCCCLYNIDTSERFAIFLHGKVPMVVICRVTGSIQHIAQAWVCGFPCYALGSSSALDMPFLSHHIHRPDIRATVCITDTLVLFVTDFCTVLDIETHTVLDACIFMMGSSTISYSNILSAVRMDEHLYVLCLHASGIRIHRMISYEYMNGMTPTSIIIRLSDGISIHSQYVHTQPHTCRIVVV